MEPASLSYGEYDRALAVAGAVIGDIAWHHGLLFVAVQAGYSSAIYGIDLGSRRVVSHRGVVAHSCSFLPRLIAANPVPKVLRRNSSQPSSR